MSDYAGKRFFTIHSNDAGSDAYADRYVQHLELENERLSKDCEARLQEAADAKFAAEKLRQQLAAAEAASESRLREIEARGARIAELEEVLHDAGDGDTWRAACKRVEDELVHAQAQLVAQHPESWARITKRLTDERDEARLVARNLLRHLQSHGEIPAIDPQFSWLEESNVIPN